MILDLRRDGSSVWKFCLRVISLLENVAFRAPACPVELAVAVGEFTKHTGVRLPFPSLAVGRDTRVSRRAANPLVENRPSIYSRASQTGSRCERDYSDPVGRGVRAISQHHARTPADRSGFGHKAPKPPWNRPVRRTSI